MPETSFCPNSTRRVYITVSAVMITSFVLKVIYALYTYFLEPQLNSYGYTEFLINFQGGMVRRGLLGYGLLWLCSQTGVQPQYYIMGICTAAFILVCWFFFRQFRMRGICPWLVMSPLLCGLTTFFIRKDYLLICMMIAILMLMKKGSNTNMPHRLAACVLAALGLLLHEAFIFWGIPILVLLLLANQHQQILNRIMCVALAILFLVMCYFKGDPQIQTSIIQSWNSLFPDMHLYPGNNSLGALNWGLWDTIKQHAEKNLGFKWIGLMVWPVLMFLSYYLCTFFISAFHPRRMEYGIKQRAYLSCLLITLTVCMLPMFLMLSCDYARNFQYICITSFAAFLILPSYTLQSIFPQRFIDAITRMNLSLEKRIPPKRTVITLLVLYLGIPSVGCNLYTMVFESPVGIILVFLSEAGERFLSHLF